MKRWSVMLVGVLFLSSAVVTVAHAQGAAIEKGKKVKFDYKLTVDGKVLETSEGKKPLEYTQGDGKIIPALAAQLQGMHVGETKTINLKPEEAYGPVDPKAFREFPKTALPKDMKPEVGMVLQVSGQDGRSFPATISEVKPDSIVLNFNHPLAGKALQFDVKILEIN